MAKYVIRTGENFVLELNQIESNGVPLDVSTATGALKKAASNGMIPAANIPKACDFTVVPTLVGWTFSLSPATTAALAPGAYVMDAKLTFSNGDIIITDPVQIDVRGTVS